MKEKRTIRKKIGHFWEAFSKLTTATTVKGRPGALQHKWPISFIN
jgi:hypothetical protein